MRGCWLFPILLLGGCPSEEECVPTAQPGPTPTERPAGTHRAWQVRLGDGARGNPLGPEGPYQRLSLRVELPEPTVLVVERPGACAQPGCSADLREALATAAPGDLLAPGVAVLAQGGPGSAQFEITQAPEGTLVLVRLGPLQADAQLRTLAWLQATTCDRPTVTVFPAVAGGPRCGDGLVDAPEGCDDGNAVAGDGCSQGAGTPRPQAGLCAVEAPVCEPIGPGQWRGWVCAGEPSVCEAVPCADPAWASAPGCQVPGPAAPPPTVVTPVAIGRRTAEAPRGQVAVEGDGARAVCPLAPGALHDSAPCTVEQRCPTLAASGPLIGYAGCEAQGGLCHLIRPDLGAQILAAFDGGPATATLAPPVVPLSSPAAPQRWAVGAAHADGWALTVNRSGHLRATDATGAERWTAALSPGIERVALAADGSAWAARRLTDRYHDGGALIEPVRAGTGLVVQPVSAEGVPGRAQAFGHEGRLAVGRLELVALAPAAGVARVAVVFEDTDTGTTELWVLRADGRAARQRTLGHRAPVDAVVALDGGLVVAVQVHRDTALADAPGAAPGMALLALDSEGAARWVHALPGVSAPRGVLAAGPDGVAWVGPAGDGPRWLTVRAGDGAVQADRAVDLAPCGGLVAAVPTAEGGLVVARQHCGAAVGAVTRLEPDGGVRWVERFGAGALQHVSVVGLAPAADGAWRVLGAFRDPSNTSGEARVAP